MSRTTTSCTFITMIVFNYKTYRKIGYICFIILTAKIIYIFMEVGKERCLNNLIFYFFITLGWFVVLPINRIVQKTEDPIRYKWHKLIWDRSRKNNDDLYPLLMIALMIGLFFVPTL